MPPTLCRRARRRRSSINRPYGADRRRWSALLARRWLPGPLANQLFARFRTGEFQCWPHVPPHGWRPVLTPAASALARHGEARAIDRRARCAFGVKRRFRVSLCRFIFSFRCCDIVGGVIITDRLMVIMLARGAIAHLLFYILVALAA